MRFLRGSGLTVAVFVVVFGGFLALTPHGRQFASSYGPEMATRASEAFSSTPAAPVTDLTSVGQMQADFNAAAGQPRLILLLSPT